MISSRLLGFPRATSLLSISRADSSYRVCLAALERRGGQEVRVSMCVLIDLYVSNSPFIYVPVHLSMCPLFSLSES